jgi:hypothetical protein
MLSALLGAAPVAAQPTQVEFATGVAIPQAGLATARRSGPLVRASLSRRDRIVRPRGDLELFTLTGRRSGPPIAQGARYTGISTSVSLLVGKFTAPVTPYALLGLGAVHVRLHGDDRQTTTAQVRYGLGVRYETYERAFFAEAGQQAILSDIGNRDYAVGVVWPVVAGVSWRIF